MSASESTADARTKHRIIGRRVSATVQNTANSIAGLRALESERENPLFVDPFAAALAGEETMTRIRAKREMTKEDGTGTAAVRDVDKGRIAIRTRFFDDAVRAFAREVDAEELRESKKGAAGGGKKGSAAAKVAPGGDASGATPRQIVLLGSGYDTRAWRLEASSPAAKAATTVFELDVEAVLTRKRDIIGDAPFTLCEERICVYADIEHRDWFDALKTSGFSEKAPTCWVLEGLMYYLKPRVAKRLLTQLALYSAPGSTLAASVVNPASLRRARSAPVCLKLARCFGRARRTGHSMWKSACDKPPDAYFAPWSVEIAAQVGEGPLNYGRWTGQIPEPAPSTNKAYKRDKTPRTFYVRCRKY